MNYTFKPERYSSHSLLLRSFPPEGRGLRVLDVGCAGGYLAHMLAARGFAVVGVDKAVGNADQLPEGLEFVEADLDAGLPALPSPFSFILCADVLEHLRDPLSLLLDLRALLRPEGRLIASLPNSGNIYFRLKVLRGRFPSHDRGLFDRTHLHFYAWPGWADLLSSGGFLVEKVGVTAMPFGLALPRWNGTPLVRSLEALSYGAALLWKNLFAYQFIVVARPSCT